MVIFPCLKTFSQRPTGNRTIRQHPFQVAGGGPGWQVAGIIHSALYSVLNAALHSVLSGKLGPLPSIQPSVIDSAIYPPHNFPLFPGFSH